MAREYYAQRQNPDGSVTRYRTEDRYWQARVSSMGAAARRVSCDNADTGRHGSVKFYSVDFTFST